MVQVITKRAPLLIAVCKQCLALLTFHFEDVSNSQITCPICGNKVVTPVMDKYDGVMKREGEIQKNE